MDYSSSPRASGSQSGSQRGERRHDVYSPRSRADDAHAMSRNHSSGQSSDDGRPLCSSYLDGDCQTGRSCPYRHELPKAGHLAPRPASSSTSHARNGSFSSRDQSSYGDRGRSNGFHSDHHVERPAPYTGDRFESPAVERRDSRERETMRGQQYGQPNASSSMYALPSHQQDGQPSGQFTQDRSSGANEGWPPYKKEITNWGGPIEPVEIPDSSISRTATSSHPSSWQTSRSPAGFIAPRDQYVQRQSQTHADRYERRPSPSFGASRSVPHYDDRGQQPQPQTVRPRSPPRVYEDRAATPRHSSSRFASESYGGPAAVDDEGWPAPKKEIRGFTSEIEDHLSSDLANQRKASSVISSTYSSGWKTTQPSTAPQATRQDGTESYATNGRPERPSSQTKSHTAQTPRYVNGAGSLQNGRSDRAQPSSSEGPPISLREYLATEHRQMLGEAPSKANGHEQDKGTRTPTKDVRSPGATQRIELIEDGDTSLRPSESASNIGSGSSYEDAADADGWKEYAPGQRTQWRTGKFADDQAVEGPEGVYTYKAQHAEDDDMPLLHRQTERHTPEQHGRVAEESHKRRSSVNAPTPKRWDSVGQNAVDGLERAATPRASQSTISPSIERSEPKANELSIKGVSRHLDETQALKDENAALKARLKVLEERHAAPTANEADADRIAALQRDNVALLSELEYFRASRHAASKLLSPLLQLLAPNGFRVDTKEP